MLEVLIGAFGAGLGKALPQEIVKSIFSAIAEAQSRRVWRRAIRDVIEDEVFLALDSHGVDANVAHEYVRERKKYYKQEVRNRFDHALQD